MASAELAKLVALNRYLMLRGTAPMPVTNTGIVRQTSVDSNGITQSYSLEVDGAEYPNVPAVGTSFGQGWTVPVYRSGGAAVGDWIVGNYPLSFGSQAPVVVGGITTAQPSTFPANFGFWVNGEGGWLVGGGLNDEDGVAIPYGSRSEVRSYGLVGYDPQELLVYGFINAPFTYTEAGVDHLLEAGDQHLGYYGAGHLELRSTNRRLAWMNGPDVVWSSEVVDLGNGNFMPLNWLRGMLWLGENYVGAGMQLGRQADGANLFQLLNESNIPLVTFRAGFEDDVNAVYARLGPPDPFPNFKTYTLRQDTMIGGVLQPKGTIIVDLHGGVLRAGTVTADKMSVNQLSALAADLGIVTAGDIRLGEGTVGTNFTGLRMYKSGTTYALEGFLSGTKQAYFGSDGKIYSGDGKIWIENNKVMAPFYAGQFEFYDENNLTHEKVMGFGGTGGGTYVYGGLTVFGINANNRHDAYAVLAASSYDTLRNGSIGVLASQTNSKTQAFVNTNEVGFFGTSTAAKQTVTGAKGSNAALASLLTALAAYGLITDSTSA